LGGFKRQRGPKVFPKRGALKTLGGTTAEKTKVGGHKQREPHFGGAWAHHRVLTN